MRLRWLLLPILTLAALALLAAACGDDGDDGGPAASDTDGSGADDAGPTSSGAIVAETFLTFDGQQYELSDILQADLVSAGEFTEIGVADAADIDYEGELKVFRREGDDAAVYTFTPAVDGDGEEGDVPATWGKWEP